MRQTLFHIPETLFGQPLFGFGLLFWAFLAIFLISVVWNGRRNGFMKELLEQLPVAVLTFFVIVVVAPRVAEPGEGFPIRGYGVFMLLGIVAGLALLLFQARKIKKMPPTTILSLAMTGVLCGLIGGRVFHVVEYWEHFNRPTLGSHCLPSSISPRVGLSFLERSFLGRLGPLGLYFGTAYPC